MIRTRLSSAALIICAFLGFQTVNGQDHPEEPKAPAIEGRWDITLQRDNRDLPSWLEVLHSGSATVGYFVSTGGSARPISKVNVDGNKFSFAIPAQFERGPGELKMEGTVNGDVIEGTFLFPDDKTHTFKGKRAPALRARTNVTWGTPIVLFNGKDLTGWKATGATNQWVVEDGALKSPKTGSNIRSEQTFKDFKLHIEFRYPKGSNSGVYLRGRYEVQVSDNTGKPPTRSDFGAIYGFIIPAEMAAKGAGEWQTFDITLIGRMVTVVANGKPIITNQEILGITGGALDSNEELPGPIMMQGDHGPVEYRNIRITPAKD